MTEILLAIHTLLLAPKVDKSVAELALQVRLRESERNPYWVYFMGKGKSPAIEVDFRESLTSTAWLLALRFDIEKSPRRAEVPLDQYGPVISLEPNPQIPPEGTTTYVYRCNGIRISFSFTSKSDKLCQIVLRRDLP